MRATSSSRNAASLKAVRFLGERIAETCSMDGHGRGRGSAGALASASSSSTVGPPSRL
jgi:hypothetical protein